jgi:hypothetical protein
MAVLYMECFHQAQIVMSRVSMDAPSLKKDIYISAGKLNPFKSLRIKLVEIRDLTI